MTLLCGHIVQRIFFGALRPNEVEVCCNILPALPALTLVDSVCTKGYGFSSPNRYLLLPYFEMSSTHPLPSCLGSCCSSSHSIGSPAIALNGCVPAPSEATPLNDSSIDGPKTIPRPSTPVSSKNEHSLRHIVGYRPHHVCFRRRAYDICGCRRHGTFRQ